MCTSGKVLVSFTTFLEQCMTKNHPDDVTLSVPLRLGWTNISDDELLVLACAIGVKKKLQELWYETF